MKALHLIVLGKLKDKNILEIENDYLKRINNPSLKIHEVKSHQEDLDLEAKEVLKKIKNIYPESNPLVILMAENGTLMTGPELSKWVDKKIETNGQIIFIIGGSSGHGKSVIKRADEKLSLSPLTYPHKLARLLLVEQLYRSQTISRGHPYHK